MPEHDAERTAHDIAATRYGSGVRGGVSGPSGGGVPAAARRDQDPAYELFTLPAAYLGDSLGL
jgi:hypothetical protein